MACVHTAYLKRENVPARKALQGAINRLGFKVTLDDSYIPFNTAGYHPFNVGRRFAFRTGDPELSSAPSSARRGDHSAAESARKLFHLRPCSWL